MFKWIVTNGMLEQWEENSQYTSTPMLQETIISNTSISLGFREVSEAWHLFPHFHPISGVPPAGNRIYG